jgi:hypothetical protein
MTKKKLSFSEIVTAAAKPVPELWDQDGNLNLSAVARYYKRKGHPVTQATLHRLFHGKHGEPSNRVLEATHVVLRVPRSLLRGDPMAADVEEIFGRYPLSTILLAKRLEDLPVKTRKRIQELIEDAFEKEEQLHRVMQDSPNVTQLSGRGKPLTS